MILQPARKGITVAAAAAAAASLALPGAAQQVAANQDPLAGAPEYVAQRCGTGNESKYQRNIHEYGECVMRARTDFANAVTATAKQTAAAADARAAEDRAGTASAKTNIQCIEDLKSGRQSGAYRPEVAAGILRDARKSLYEYGPCNLLREAIALSKS